MISQASAKFRADAFTPYDVQAIEEGAKTGVPFCVTYTSGGVLISKHFAAIQFDEFRCPSFNGTATVSPSLYTGKPPGHPPASYGNPAGSKLLGSPPANASITNYVALSATHFPCMQYGLVEKLAVTTTVPADAEAPNGMIVPGPGLNLKACTDGASKTLIVCETIEPAMNCWYDGTTTWTTGINPNSIGRQSAQQSRSQPAGHGKPEPFLERACRRLDGLECRTGARHGSRLFAGT